jgi:hypothetical protein
MVKAVQAAVESIQERQTLTGYRLACVQVAIELARNIEAGNRKGRAIANEAMQLTATLEIIEGDTTEAVADGADLPEDVRTFMQQLGSLPTAPPRP